MAYEVVLEAGRRHVSADGAGQGVQRHRRGTRLGHCRPFDWDTLPPAHAAGGAGGAIHRILLPFH